METQFADTLKGRFLIAMPAMKDPNFFQSVICVCDHTAEGALGIIINKIHFSLSGQTIFRELKMPCKPSSKSIHLHIGGPVRGGELYLLHGPPFAWDSTLMITESLALSNSVDILQAIALGQGPRFFLITLGCSGWGPGQLDHEIQNNVWLTSPLSEKIISETPVENRWTEALKDLGIDPAMLSDTAGHA